MPCEIPTSIIQFGFITVASHTSFTSISILTRIHSIWILEYAIKVIGNCVKQINTLSIANRQTFEHHAVSTDSSHIWNYELGLVYRNRVYAFGFTSGLGWVEITIGWWLSYQPARQVTKIRTSERKAHLYYAYCFRPSHTMSVYLIWALSTASEF